MEIRTFFGSIILLSLISLPSLGNDDISNSCDGDDSGTRCYDVPKNKAKKFERIRNQASSHIDNLNNKLFGHSHKKFENTSGGPNLYLNEQKIREHGKNDSNLPSSIREQRMQFDEFNKPYEPPQKKDKSLTYGLGFSLKLDNNSEK